jgi:hypothetical protein
LGNAGGGRAHGGRQPVGVAIVLKAVAQFVPKLRNVAEPVDVELAVQS